MTTREGRGASYQVTIRGELKPAVLTFCAGPQADHETSGVFRLQVHDDQGIADLVAMLQAAGLTILGIRQVTQSDATSPASLSA